MSHRGRSLSTLLLRSLAEVEARIYDRSQGPCFYLLINHEFCFVTCRHVAAATDILPCARSH